MNITIFYVGSSLLAPLRQAEREINERYALDLRIAAHNCGAPLDDDEWQVAERDLAEAELVFIIHITDSENATRIAAALRNHHTHAIIAINCMPDLMRLTRMGKLDFEKLLGVSKDAKKAKQEAQREGSGKGTSLLGSIGSWIGRQARSGSKNGAKGHARAQYLKFADRLPSLLRFVPSAGALRDVKNYLMLFCYFLQPSPQNIRSMLLYALKHYVDDERVRKVNIPAPESLPVMGNYHPDAPSLFERFEDYRGWYAKRASLKGGHAGPPLRSDETIGLLLMRPQIVSDARKHYDGLIRAIEAEGLSVMPAISTLMDNREACEKFFVEGDRGQGSGAGKLNTTGDGRRTIERKRKPRVSQVVSPEHEMGLRVAHSFAAPGVLDYFDVAPGYGIARVPVTDSLVGQSLGATAWPLALGIAVPGVLTLAVWAVTRKVRAVGAPAGRK